MVIKRADYHLQITAEFNGSPTGGHFVWGQGENERLHSFKFIERTKNILKTKTFYIYDISQYSLWYSLLIAYGSNSKVPDKELLEPVCTYFCQYAPSIDEWENKTFTLHLHLVI